MDRMPVGVDGSAGSESALRWAVEGSQRTDTGIVALRAHQRPLIEMPPNQHEELVQERTAVLHDEWARVATAVGIGVETVAVRNFRPADGLLSVASGRRADLLVIGTRGAGGFSRPRVSGVAMKVLHQASLPLVLVPPAEEG